MQPLLRVIDRISGATGTVVAWVIFPLIFVTVYDVAARYLFKAPTIWAYEIGYMAMGTHALIGMAFTLREAGHIRIDFFHAAFSPRARAWIDLVGYLVLMLPVSVWLTWALWGYWMAALKTSELSGQSAWNPAIWPFKLCFFVSFALLLLQVLAQAARAAFFLAGRTASYEGDALMEPR